jgi:hypothetical protein
MRKVRPKALGGLDPGPSGLRLRPPRPLSWLDGAGWSPPPPRGLQSPPAATPPGRPRARHTALAPAGRRVGRPHGAAGAVAADGGQRVRVSRGAAALDGAQPPRCTGKGGAGHAWAAGACVCGNRGGTRSLGALHAQISFFFRCAWASTLNRTHLGHTPCFNAQAPFLTPFAIVVDSTDHAPSIHLSYHGGGCTRTWHIPVVPAEAGCQSQHSLPPHPTNHDR